MGIPNHWIVTEKDEHKCKKCGSQTFTDIGECTTCGDFLLININKKPLIIKKTTQRKIMAIEKWKSLKAPEDYICKCFICGKKANKMEKGDPSSIISTMVKMMLQEKEEWKISEKFINKAYPSNPADNYIEFLAKALIRNENVVLPVVNIKELQDIGEKFFTGKNHHVCVECLIDKYIGKKEKSKEEKKEMPPKFKQTRSLNEKWGEDTVEVEEWEDDPKELTEPEVAEEVWDDDDDWDEVDNKPKTSPGDYDDEDDDDDWDEDDEDNYDEDEEDEDESEPYIPPPAPAVAVDPPAAASASDDGFYDPEEW